MNDSQFVQDFRAGIRKGVAALSSTQPAVQAALPAIVAEQSLEAAQAMADTLHAEGLPDLAKSLALWFSACLPNVAYKLTSEGVAFSLRDNDAKLAIAPGAQIKELRNWNWFEMDTQRMRYEENDRDNAADKPAPALDVLAKLAQLTKQVEALSQRGTQKRKLRSMTKPQGIEAARILREAEQQILRVLGKAADADPDTQDKADGIEPSTETLPENVTELAKSA